METAPSVTNVGLPEPEPEASTIEKTKEMKVLTNKLDKIERAI